MHSIPKTSGVYKWVCVPTKKIYVGSSTNLYRRYYEHRHDLNTKQHCNPHLQNAWNKHGEQNFEFIVIELVLATFVEEREQYWMDKLKSRDKRFGFNMAWANGTCFGVPRSDETRRRMVIAQKGSTPSEATLRGSFEYHAKDWIVTAPDGTVYRTKGLGAFCREHSLDASGLRRTAKGMRYKGWSCYRADDTPIRKGRAPRQYGPCLGNCGKIGNCARGLCKRCYYFIRNHKDINEYPKSSKK